MKLPFDFDISMLYEISFLHGEYNTTSFVLVFTCVKETQKQKYDDDTNCFSETLYYFCY